MLGFSFDPVSAVSAQATQAAGVLTLAKIRLHAGGAVTNLVFQVATAGTVLTSGQCFVGVYDSTGALLGTSVDQSTAFASAGVKTVALVTPTAALLPGADVYFALLWNGTTGPQLRGFTTTSIANIGIAAVADSRFASAGTGLTTALPGTCPTKTAINTACFVGVS